MNTCRPPRNRGIKHTTIPSPSVSRQKRTGDELLALRRLNSVSPAASNVDEIDEEVWSLGDGIRNRLVKGRKRTSARF